MASVDDRQMWLGVEQAGSIPEVHVYSTHGADSSFMWEFQWKSRLDETPLAILSQKCPNVQVNRFRYPYIALEMCVSRICFLGVGLLRLVRFKRRIDDGLLR